MSYRNKVVNERGHELTDKALLAQAAREAQAWDEAVRTGKHTRRAATTSTRYRSRDFETIAFDEARDEEEREGY